MSAVVAYLPGDGIGPEVLEQARRVLEAAIDGRCGNRGGLEIREAFVGGAALDAAGTPLPDETLELCDEADAILLGAVGGPDWDDAPPSLRPEQGLLDLRSELGLFANLRPVRSRPATVRASPLRPDLLEGVDLLIVRELIGGLYFGPRKRDGEIALDTCVYSEAEIERVARIAFERARERRGRVTSVDKANVLESSRLWRETLDRIAGEFPDVELEHRYVDAMAMHLMLRPAAFDVIVTGNLFGDILSDEAAVLAGSLGMLPSASLDATGKGLFEPVHGTAPGIACQGIANPYGAILSVALLLRHGLVLEEAAAAVESAVDAALEDGFLPRDLSAAPSIGSAGPAATDESASTAEIGDAVLARLQPPRGRPA